MRLGSRIGMWPVWVLGALALGGCVPQVIFPPVTYVPTHTPGLKYVIVRHSALTDPYGSEGTFSKSSDYVLLCDGRGIDGMHCSIPPEVGLHVSVGPNLPQAPTPVPTLIGALGGLAVESAPTESTSTAPAAAGNAAAPAMPTINIPIPPPSVKAAPAIKGGR
jgi:hypothetical protein